MQNIFFEFNEIFICETAHVACLRNFVSRSKVNGAPYDRTPNFWSTVIAFVFLRFIIFLLPITFYYFCYFYFFYHDLLLIWLSACEFNVHSASHTVGFKTFEPQNIALNIVSKPYI